MAYIIYAEQQKCEGIFLANNPYQQSGDLTI